MTDEENENSTKYKQWFPDRAHELPRLKHHDYNEIIYILYLQYVRSSISISLWVGGLQLMIILLRFNILDTVKMENFLFVLACCSLSCQPLGFDYLYILYV